MDQHGLSGQSNPFTTRIRRLPPGVEAKEAWLCRNSARISLVSRREYPFPSCLQ